jgi:Domain of Unknown Function (DUF928)
MAKKKLSDRPLVLTLTLTFLLVGMQNSFGLQSKPQHQELLNSISQNPIERLIYNQPEEDKGVPGDRAKGGGENRDNCQTIDATATNKLIALVPKTNIGFTITDRPTFWFYIPFKTGVTAEFTLRDENNRVVYTTHTFQLTNTPGIISITLPQTVSGLDIGSIETGKKRYRWFFSVICNSERRDEDITVKGYVQRIALSQEVMNRIKQATGRDRLLLYAKNGLWYNAITDLSEMRRRQPQDRQIATDWADLMANEKIQLKELNSTPIVSCCTMKN